MGKLITKDASHKAQNWKWHAHEPKIFTIVPKIMIWNLLFDLVFLVDILAIKVVALVFWSSSSLAAPLSLTHNMLNGKQPLLLLVWQAFASSDCSNCSDFFAISDATALKILYKRITTEGCNCVTWNYVCMIWRRSPFILTRYNMKTFRVCVMFDTLDPDEQGWCVHFIAYPNILCGLTSIVGYRLEWQATALRLK